MTAALQVVTDIVTVVVVVVEVVLLLIVEIYLQCNKRKECCCHLSRSQHR